MNFKLWFVILIIYYKVSPSMAQADSSTGSASVLIPDSLDRKQNKDQSALMTRPGSPVGLASKLNQLEAEFREKMEQIKTQTSINSEDQNEKIANIRASERNLARLLNQTREEMVGLKTQNKDQAKRIDQLEQKLAMLQIAPTSSSALPRGINSKDRLKEGASNNKDFGSVPKLLRPPSSCHELAILDYYSDGLYLVKSKETNKIQTVFCQFSTDNKTLETFIGNVELKTKNAHFYVQRKTHLKVDGVIPFEIEQLNVGGAMSSRTGYFTAPVNGIYHFEFSSVKGFEYSGQTSVDLKVNGNIVGASYVFLGNGHLPFSSLSASLALKAGDKVFLEKSGGAVLTDGYHRLTHFSGWLVEENFPALL